MKVCQKNSNAGCLTTRRNFTNQYQGQRWGTVLQSSGMHSIYLFKMFFQQAILEVLIRQSNRFSANHLIKIHDVKAGYF